MMIVAALAAVYILPSTAIPADTVPVDTAAVYSAVIDAARFYYPDYPVVLSESWADEDCIAVCTGRPSPPLHSPEVLGALRRQGMIASTCRMEPDVAGCRSDVDDPIFVALGTVRATPLRLDKLNLGEDFRTWPQTQNDVWVTVISYVPSAASGAVPQSHAYRFLLRKEGAGGWKVLRLVLLWHTHIRWDS